MDEHWSFQLNKNASLDTHPNYSIFVGAVSSRTMSCAPTPRQLIQLLNSNIKKQFSQQKASAKLKTPFSVSSH